MIKILRNFKSHKKAVALAFLLLLAQAFCDLAIPDFTADLIDTGIVNSGIMYAVPDTIRPQQHAALAEMMKPEEAQQWKSIYSPDENGLMQLKKASKKERQQLDETYLPYLSAAEVLRQLSPEKKHEVELLLQTHPQLIQEKIEESATMGSGILRGTAIAFTKAEYEAAGISTADIQRRYLMRVGGDMILATLLLVASSILLGLLAARVSAAIGRQLREKVFHRVVEFSDVEMNHFSTASLITRSTNDIQQVQTVCFMLMRVVCYAPVLAIGGLIMVLQTGAHMGWIILVAILAVLVVVLFLLITVMPRFKRMQKLVDRVNLVAREILTGLSVIRAFGREKEEEKRFDRANRELTGTMLFANRAMTLMMPTMMLIMNGVVALTAWVSAGKIEAGLLEVGTMTAFITYAMQIIMSFLVLCAVSVVMPRAAVSADRIDEVLTTEPAIRNPEEPKQPAEKKGIVRFDHVTFTYPQAEQPTLEDISFTAKPGEITAVIGSTGSGKSTLVQLIPRFYDVTEGAVTVDGVDVRDYTQETLRGQIGYVPQKGVLFSGTIAGNICYGLPQEDAAVMQEAAEIAQADSFIKEKSDGYQSEIAQGGSNVSGGQKQRLSIARAIAKNPAIYIFDDSFSALDFKTDAVLRRALQPKIKNSTVFIVAQRISTVMYADRILVLDDGRLVGMGTHRELLQNCEIYRQIAASQFSLEELEKKAVIK